jgi:hypothetical protein
MIRSNTALLDALADCLGSGDTLFEALAKIGTVKGTAEAWAQQVRRSVRSEVPLASALRESGVLDDEELSLLSGEGADAAAASALHAVALRRQRSLGRRSAIRWGLVAPFAFGVLAVVLDPLPNLITGGAFLWPVFRGLFTFVIPTLAIFAGIPALLRSRRTRPAALRLCSAIPGVRRLADLYAEEELTTALAPFVDNGSGGVTTAGLSAAASLLAWSPSFVEALRRAARSVPPAPGPLATGRPHEVGGPGAGLEPMGRLEPLARQLSLATDLAIVGGVASQRLAQRLTQRAEAIAPLLTARLRLVTRVGAYTLVVLFSISSLVDMVSRGLPGVSTVLGGGATTPEQKQLEDLLKQLEQ